MKKKIVTILMTAAIGTSMLAGQTVMAAEAEAKTEAKADDAKDSEETKEEKTIGEKPAADKDAEGVFSLKFKNLTGKAITEVSVKNEKDEKYPDNFLEKDDKFAADEERTLWFDPNASKTEEKTETADTAKDTAEAKDSDATEEVQKYDMQITFEDGKTATLHTLPFGDTEEAELHLEGEVAYLVFDSKSLKESVNTKDTEQELAPKPTEAPAQQDSSQTEDYSYDSSEDYSYDSSDDYSYDYDESYDDSSDESYDDSSADSGDSDAGSGDDGCLDDAILN